CGLAPRRSADMVVPVLCFGKLLIRVLKELAAAGRRRGRFSRNHDEIVAAPGAGRRVALARCPDSVGKRNQVVAAFPPLHSGVLGPFWNRARKVRARCALATM